MARRASLHNAERKTPNEDSFGGWVPLEVAVTRFAHLGANRGRLQVAAWRGTLPSRKLGSYARAPLLFRLKDVERYLAERRPQESAAAA